MFLWLLLGEYGLEFLHTHHDILGGMYGTFKVQRGYPSTMEDMERLPHRKKIYSHNIMLVDGFGMWNVKERSHGVTRALTLRPTSLSLESMFLLMECPKGSMHPSFLHIFMRTFSWEDSFMDLTFRLLTMHGNKYIYVLIDCSIEYLYLLTIYGQYIAPHKRKIIVGLHGHFRANIYNDDNPSLRKFG